MRRYILRPDPCRPSKYHHRRIWWGAGEVIKLQNLPKKWTKTRQTLTHWNMSRDTPMTNEYGILLWWLCHESLLLLISRKTSPRTPTITSLILFHWVWCRGEPGTAAVPGVRCPGCGVRWSGLEPAAEQDPASTSSSLWSYKNTHKESCCVIIRIRRCLSDVCAEL